MKKLLRSPAIVFAIIIAIYASYFIACLMNIRNLPSIVLVDLALYPGDISAEWKLVPVIDRISVALLKGRNLTAVEADFEGLGYTLYSGALGYRDVNSDPRKPRPQSEEVRARELTEILYKKGVRVSGPVDLVGCSSVHQAILANDINSAKFLLSLEGVGDVLGKIDAKYKPCRRSIMELAKARGLPM